MGKENRSYRIRTNVDKDNVVNFNMNNTVDSLEILSLEIKQENVYKLMGSDTGIIAGRVLANGGFGVSNAKISVFIEYEETDDVEKRVLYSYASTRDTNYDGIRYNLLPTEVDSDCHQNIGTFPGKRLMLDNNSWIDVFDKYYKYTTRTNEAGDYLIYGVPTGMQTVHMDVDLSDIGVLSQKPRDLIYKGYNANMFESPTKFRVDTNIDSLAQIITQDQSVYVYPFWGDTTDSNLNVSITRCDININYKFEPTCVFMGSVISDTGENAMSKKCVGAKKQGLMSDMITGEGKIEMIRKTPNGQVEQFSINGDNNINSDGVWCYQIPMNLDYVMHDEFGKMVMTDNPNIGIPTRTRVRFRLYMSDSPSDATARKRARFLIPNNPRLVEDDYPEYCETKEIDYEFGTKTKDENFRDLFWNNVYTVKSYIPRLQKSRLPNNMKHLGIKMVNHSGSNNPMPFNNLRIKFNFVYMFLCTLVKVLVTFVGAINAVLTLVSLILVEIGKFFFKVSKELNFSIFGTYWFDGVCKLFAEYNNHGIRDSDGLKPDDYLVKVWEDMQNGTTLCKGVAVWFMKIFLNIGCGIVLKGMCETDSGVEINVSPGTNDNVRDLLKKLGIMTCNDRVDTLYNCIENQLAQDNEVTSFNFYNDWVNGVVYLPLWYRRIKKRINGTIKKDEWCSTDNTTVQTRAYKKNLKLYNTNVPKRVVKNSSEKTMGTINPLINSEDSVSAIADNETGIERLNFAYLDDSNCYGYQCHKHSRTFFKVYKGLIYEKTTMLGDKVYYYKPCDYDTSTGNRDLVTLFATDLVLLGSLAECDIHGIPQFFKSLESTTYNMPPDLLSEDYDYINENNQTTPDEAGEEQIDLGSRITEYTGADWGNLGVDQSNYNKAIITILGSRYDVDANENEYDNGGLFYGLTCFNSYTKPKSCINLARICEFGVSLDESNELPSTNGNGTESDTEVLTPDGFISYDDIYNPDYRSMFATLNSNFLRTKLNPETGLLEYDFDHMYLDNFDGSLKLLMKARTVNGKTEKSNFEEKANYVGNYNLEESSDAYLNFRYGNYTKRNGKKIYFYENDNTVAYPMNVKEPINGKDRQPRYENSFYFYFGLNEGKTAIDKFNTEFFSDCAKNFASDIPYDLTYQGNSWCPTDSTDGFIAFKMYVEAPYSVKFTRKDDNVVYIRDGINETKFIFCNEENKPEGYEKYEVYGLYKKTADDIVNSANEPVYIIPNGTYTIEVTDAYDNKYKDNITFELPRIGFICDVNPFVNKNAELLEKFKGQNIKETYTNIANAGRFINNSTINELDRDIRGFIALSEITEDHFRVKFKPINEDFFGDNYIGTSFDVQVSQQGIEVSGYDDVQDECGYLGYTVNSDGVITHYIGVPYGGQRYRITVTQLCDDGGESNNVTTINVIVYEDEFKLYINNIDYDLIQKFKTGWDDYKLIDSAFKNDGDDYSTFNKDNVYGWTDILNIGQYEYSGTTKQLTQIDYGMEIGEVLAVCEALNPNYVSNTPYVWSDEYCYIAPSDNSDYYYKGTVNKTDSEQSVDIVRVDDINNNTASYVADINGNTTVVATEDANGVVTMGDGYSDLACMTFYEYRDIINRINEVIHNRSEIVREIAAAFRINEGETTLTLTTKTKAKPVKYLIAGNSEISLLDGLYGYRPTTSGRATRIVPIRVRTLNEIDNTSYVSTATVKYVSDGYVVDKNLETPNVSFSLPTLTNDYNFVQYGNSELIYNGNEYYSEETIACKQGDVIKPYAEYYFYNTTTSGSEYYQHNTNGSTEITVSTADIGKYFYITGEKIKNTAIIGDNGKIPIGQNPHKTVSDFVEYAHTTSRIYKIGDTKEYMPYYANKNKHPYYVSVMNDNESIIPYGDDFSNFTELGDNKKLDITFGVHFYNKPLKSDFKVVFSSINNIPAYPEYPLGDDSYIGWGYNYDKANYYWKKYEDSEILSPGTVVYALGQPAAQNFEWECEYYVYEVQDGYHKYSENDIIKAGQVYYIKMSAIMDKFIPYTADREITVISEDEYYYLGEKCGDIIQRERYTALYNFNFIKCDNESEYVVYNGDIIYHTRRSESSSIYHKGTVDINYTDYGNSMLLKEYMHTLGIDFEDVYYPTTIAPIVVNNHVNKAIKRDNNFYPIEIEPDANNNNIATINNHKITYKNSGKYRYSAINDEPIKLYLKKNPRGEYYYITFNNEYPYHGVERDIISTKEATEHWVPVDVLMPGFMTGYVYNGIPRSGDDNSNIRAELNETEVNLYTPLYTPTDNNDDVYENINVRRLVYTPNDTYDANYPPTYGVFDSLEPSSGLNYQYAEVPMVDADFVYTDGYGEKYSKTVLGTLAVLFDNPVLTYFNLGKDLAFVDNNLQYEDNLVTRTFYTSDDGYTRHQSLYYLFDLDKTKYPLLYYNTGDPASALNSNLKYDDVNNRYYFKEMPEILRDIDNQSVSHYISKSKSTNFNVCEYIRKKYGQTNNYVPLEVSRPNDKFFVIGCVDGYYTISPVIETQIFQCILNYNGFDNRSGDWIYFTARDSRVRNTIETMRGGIHYIEDMYYMLYYRFIVHVASFDYSVDNGKYNSDVYTQVCSVPEGTAEHCYIKVEDRGENLTYWASAIKVNLSSLGADAMDDNGRIHDWLQILIEDKSDGVRVTLKETGGVDVTEFDTFDSMMHDYNESNNS